METEQWCQAKMGSVKVLTGGRKWGMWSVKWYNIKVDWQVKVNLRYILVNLRYILLAVNI